MKAHKDPQLAALATTLDLNCVDMVIFKPKQSSTVQQHWWWG